MDRTMLIVLWCLCVATAINILLAGSILYWGWSQHRVTYRLCNEWFNKLIGMEQILMRMMQHGGYKGSTFEKPPDNSPNAR